MVHLKVDTPHSPLIVVFQRPQKKIIDIALFSYIIISVLRPKSAISRSPAKGGADASGGKEDDQIC